MQTKIALSVLVFASCLFGAHADRMIYRDGSIDEVKIVQVRDSKIIYMDPRVTSKKLEMPTTELYMVSIEDVGNIYYNELGERRAGESKPAKTSKTDIVYLVSGMEVPCENAYLNGDFVNFKVKDTSRLKEFKESYVFDKNKKVNIPREEIFMICYKNGVNDLITPLISEIELEPEESQQAQSMKVIFHELQQGEKLDDVASKYNVSIEEIGEWNDLRKVKGKYIVNPGTQLMIYLNKQ